MMFFEAHPISRSDAAARKIPVYIPRQMALVAGLPYLARDPSARAYTAVQETLVVVRQTRLDPLLHRTRYVKAALWHERLSRRTRGEPPITMLSADQYIPSLLEYSRRGLQGKRESQVEPRGCHCPRRGDSIVHSRASHTVD